MGPIQIMSMDINIIKLLKMYLYNKGKTRNLEDDGIILAEFGSTRRFVDLLRWTH